MLHPRILKFGGTSVADAAAVERVTGVVREHGGPRPVVVVSALAGATDALLAAADAAAAGHPRGTAPSLDALLERHARIANQLVRPEARKALLGDWRRRGARSPGCSTTSSRSQTGERHCGTR